MVQRPVWLKFTEGVSMRVALDETGKIGEKSSRCSANSVKEIGFQCKYNENLLKKFN